MVIVCFDLCINIIILDLVRIINNKKKNMDIGSLVGKVLMDFMKKEIVF